jgi:ribosomal-protein-alanine N-acetyltransferase
MRFMEWGPNTPEDTREFLDRVICQQQEIPRKHYSLAVEARDQGPVGTMALFGITAEESGEAELGYTFNAQHWGQGYATEGALTIMDFGFGQLGLHKIYAKCVTEHSQSAHVMEKSGMQREGCFREHRLVHGEWKDYYFYAIIDHEWHKQRKDSVG